MTRLSSFATAALMALPLPAAALPLTGDHVPLVFGDSLSDPGNLFAAAIGTGAISGPLPQFPFNQITNGQTWASRIGADFASGRNFAVADAKATADTIFEADPTPDDGIDNPIQIPVPGFDSQIDTFLAEPPSGSFERAVVFFGGNDLLEIDNPFDVGGVQATIDETVQAIRSGIDRLSNAGISEFLVMGLPNGGRIPEAISIAETLGPFFGTLLQASLWGITLNFNATLQTALAQIPTPVEVTYFDTFRLIEDLMADAGSLGISNIEDACLTDPTDPATVCGDPETFFFYDSLHWSDKVHGEVALSVAEAFPADLKPIPLPAGGLLLMAGLGALAVARTRRSAA